MAAITPVTKLPPKESSIVFGLANHGQFFRKVWTNPAFDPRTSGDAAITVQPPLDMVEEMFPDPKLLFRRMTIQFWAVVVFIIGHALVTAYTDPIYTRTPLTQVIVYSGQVGLLLAIIMAFFVLTSQTLYIQFGRYDLYLSEFAFIYLLFLLELVLYAAVKVYATVLLLKRASYLDIWDFTAYAPLWVIQRVVLMLFWAAAAYSAIAVFDVRYFDPELFVTREESKESQRQQKQRQRAKKR